MHLLALTTVLRNLTPYYIGIAVAADGGKAGGADGDADGEEDEAEWGNGWECLAGPWRHLLLLVCELGLAATSLGLLAAAAVGMMALSRRRQTPAMWLLGLRHEMELERWGRGVERRGGREWVATVL